MDQNHQLLQRRLQRGDRVLLFNVGVEGVVEDADAAFTHTCSSARPCGG